MINTRILTTPLDRTRSLDRMFDQALGNLAGRVWVPAMDVAERRDAYIVQAELPGVNAEQVDVHFEQNVLTISGIKNSGFNSSSPEEVRLFAAERAHGEFTRSVRLPDGADTEHIEATFSNGLLTVTVPKAKAAQPRKITVNAASGSTALKE